MIKCPPPEMGKTQETPLAAPYKDGRGDRIRTYGLCFPKAALYQAELHPDWEGAV
ncbi:unnamed protein product [marine sediment metagenome]|uniref:Uncharacterized protein n=1 Tax=marine sediment metagenome TaxID=412755 RepID=X1D4A8_9ZZZZ